MHERARAREAHAVPGELLAAHRAAHRAAGPALLPELLQLLAQLLARRRPVAADRVADLRHVALEVQLVLLEPRHVELLPRRAALELPRDVLLVVAHDPEGWVRVSDDCWLRWEVAGLDDGKGGNGIEWNGRLRLTS